MIGVRLVSSDTHLLTASWQCQGSHSLAPFISKARAFFHGLPTLSKTLDILLPEPILCLGSLRQSWSALVLVCHYGFETHVGNQHEPWCSIKLRPLHHQTILSVLKHDGRLPRPSHWPTGCHVVDARCRSLLLFTRKAHIWTKNLTSTTHAESSGISKILWKIVRKTQLQGFFCFPLYRGHYLSGVPRPSTDWHKYAFDQWHVGDKLLMNEGVVALKHQRFTTSDGLKVRFISLSPPPPCRIVQSNQFVIFSPSYYKYLHYRFQFFSSNRRKAGWANRSHNSFERWIWLGSINPCKLMLY